MKKLVLYIAVVFIFASCGTTSIISHSEADIYVNNSRMGKGMVEITRTGFPQKKHITIKYEGRTEKEETIKRKFDILTFVAGWYTYGIGWITCWRYPSSVFLPVESPLNNEEYVKDTWRKQSKWTNPPGVWGK